MKCALCLNDKELRNSHIIPEFLYKPMYDEKHRFNIIALSDNQKRGYLQKGLREKLLCGDCEQKLSVYENEARQIFYGGKEILIHPGNPTKIEEIDYTKFKLFQLSILFRAAVSKLEFFENVIIGPHTEKLRKMILEENPGKRYDYPCMIVFVLMEEKKAMDAFIHPPEMLKIEGHRTCRFIFGGAFWIFWVSSHAEKMSFPQLILDESGSIIIPIKSARDLPFFKGLAEDVVKYNPSPQIDVWEE